MKTTELIALVFGAVAAACQVIVAAALLYSFSKMGKLDGNDNKINFGKKLDIGQVNMSWALYYFPIFTGVICLVFAVYEILLIIPQLAAWGDLFDAPLFRAFFYLCIGILVIGYSGDLGIAAGTFGILSGVLVAVAGVMKNLK